MKKLICFALIAACLLSLASCSLFGKDDGENEGPKTPVAKISEIVNNSSPTKVYTKIEYVGSETLTAKYTTLVDRNSGNSKFDFEYQRVAKIEEMLPSNVKTVKGSIWYDADGNVSHNEGETWVAEDVSGYLAYSLEISETRFAKYEMKDGENDLYAEISPAEAKRVFGADISAEGNIVLEIDTNGKYLYLVTIRYTAKDTGAIVTIQNSYDYATVNISYGQTEN